MNARTIARWLAIATVVGAGITMIRELYSWEWHRALVAGTFTLIAEVALATSLILDRLAKAQSSNVTAPQDRQQRFADQLTATRPKSRDQFAWMRDPSRTNVFIPLLMGAGVVLSGMAWLVERLAARTTGRVADRRLARRLHRALPVPGDLVPRAAQPDHPALMPLLAPRRRQ